MCPFCQEPYNEPYLTTPWPKARKNLNLRSKFKDFSCAFGQGVGILFFVGVFFPTIWSPRGGSFVCAVFGANLSFARFWTQISSFSRHFLETLTETGSIHWVGVQTWLQSSHEGKRWWHPRWGSFVCGAFRGKSPLFCATFWKHLQRWVLYTESVDNICFVLDQRTFVCAPQGGWFFSPKKIHSATGGQFTESALLCHSLRLLVSPLPSPTWLILGQDSCAVWDL